MGKVWMPGGGGSGVTSDELTATKDCVLQGMTYVGYDTDDEAGVGTIVDQGYVDATLSAGDTLKLPKGYYSYDGVITVQPLSVLTAAGTATAADIVTGQKAYVKGSLITGTMPKLSAEATIKYATGNDTPVIVADTYFLNTNTDDVERLCFRYAGNRGLLNANTLFAISTADLHLLAQNIKKGVRVCGVTGTFEGYGVATIYIFNNPTNTDGFTVPTNCGISGGSLWWNTSAVIQTVNVYDLYKYDRLIMDVGIDPAYSSVQMTYGLYDNSTPYNTDYAAKTSWESNRAITEKTSIIVYLSQQHFTNSGRLFIQGNPGLRVYSWYLVKD